MDIAFYASIFMVSFHCLWSVTAIFCSLAYLMFYDCRLIDLIKLDIDELGTAETIETVVKWRAGMSAPESVQRGLFVLL